MITNYLLSQLLVLGLLIITNARFMFFSKVKLDSLAVVPFFVLFASIINIFAFGITPLEIAILIVTLFTVFWNFKSCLDLLNGLVIDSYGGFFVIFSVLNLGLSVFLLVIALLFCPQNPNAKKYQIVDEVILCSGNFTEGFEYIDHDSIKKPMVLKTAKVHKISKLEKIEQEEEVEKSSEKNQEEVLAEEAEKNTAGGIFEIEEEKQEAPELKFVPEENPGELKEKEARRIAIFVPGACAKSELYNGILYKLAKDGFEVYTADFYSSDEKFFGGIKDADFLRRSLAFYTRKNNLEKYRDLCKENVHFTERKYLELLKIANPSLKDKVYFLADDDYSKAAGSAKIQAELENPERLIYVIDFALMGDYETRGFGPLENSEPAKAKVLGVKKDRSFYLSSHIGTFIENVANQN